MPKTKENNQKPSEINRNDNGLIIMDVVVLSKKRKFQTEQFDLLPFPKHPCQNHTDSAIKSDKDNENNIDQCSETASVKDSNSFVVMAGDSGYYDYDSMEYTDEIKDGSSSPSVGDGMFRKYLEFVCSEHGDRNLEEYAEKEIASDVLYPDNDVKQQNATYVLSSGRWNVNQDSSQQVTRKPTIDQEFEQYFSMLML